MYLHILIGITILYYVRCDDNEICAALQNAFPPDPKSKCCGLEDTIPNKIVGGSATDIDQYPWMALIDYRTINDILYPLCGGALISGRYVLTAAHCISSHAVEVYGIPELVRLGEYDTRNEGKDCVEVESNGQDCTDGAIRIAIENYITHPEYNKKKKVSDIGLIRLKEMAPFSYFVRPICLPDYDITLKPPENLNFYVAGWGSTKTEILSNIKLHVRVPYVKSQKCPVSHSRICAGGESGKDSCGGDSGGPLMYEDGKIFVVHGIVSHGNAACGTDGDPAVYTKVFMFKDWIYKTITE